MSMSAVARHFRPSGRGARRPLVVAVYLAAFFCGLPWLLWELGGRLDALIHLPRLHGPVLRDLGVCIAIVGTAWMGWSMAILSVRGGGLPISHLPPARLVARGPYAHMRHPIYVGYAAAFAGAGLAAGSLGRAIVATALLAAGSFIHAAGFEEPRLVRRYGPSYAAYVAEVPLVPTPRWIVRAASLGWRSVHPAIESFANRVVLFRVGPTLWVTYGAFAGLGAGLGLSVCHLLLRGHLSFRLEALYLLGITVAMLLGARVVALLYRLRTLLFDPLDAIRQVGFVSWGGYVGMFAFPWLFGRWAGCDPWWLLDRTVLSGLVCSCLGRIGCLSYGCCYGHPAKGGVCWHRPEAKVNRELGSKGCVARVPTQLLSAFYVAALVPVVAATLVYATPGVAAILGSLLYCFGRFAVECLRDEPRFGPWALTRGQLASAFGATVSIVLLLVLPASTAPGTSAPYLSLEPTPPAAWLAVVAAALVVFVCCSVHWKRVGRW